MASRSSLLLLLLLALPAHAGPVETGKLAWDQLRAGQQPEATKTFESLLTNNPDPLAKAGDTMARRWLTRLDREQVKAALLTAYAGKIEFPASLAGIQPPTDRWGKPWLYELAKPKHIPGIAKQTYRLESTALGAGSDLATALKIPYSSRITLEPVSVASGVVSFKLPGRTQPVLLSVGASFDDVTLAAVTATEIILTDGDHWKTFPLPAK